MSNNIVYNQSSRLLTRADRQRRCMVWHAGFEHSREASAIAQQIHKLTTAAIPQSEDQATRQIVAKLKKEYAKLTGEPFDDDKADGEQNN